MPDSPDRQVPPPPPEGGATPVPDVSSRSGQVPRSRSERRSVSRRPAPPARGQLGDNVPTPPVPPAPPSDRSVASERGASERPSPKRRQPLAQTDGALDKGARPSARERLQRLAEQQERVHARDPKATEASRRPTPPASSPTRPGQGDAAATAARRVQPERPHRRAQVSHESASRAVPQRSPQAAPVVPEPPSRQPARSGSSRIPEPPARTAAQQPARRRPTNRILEALDAKLAADQAEQAKEKVARRERDDAVRRVRPALSPRRPHPPKAPTPSVTSSVPIAPRPPQPGRGHREVEAPIAGVGGAADMVDTVVPLPDPSVPPVPVIPLKPSTASPLAAVGVDDTTPTASVNEPAEDPLSASYERLVKAAKRQAALEAALAPEDAQADPVVEDEPSADTDVLDSTEAGVLDSEPVLPDVPVLESEAQTVASEDAAVDPLISVVPAEPGTAAAYGDLHEEFEQAKRDAERFFGPDDFTPPEADHQPAPAEQVPESADAASPDLVPDEVRHSVAPQGKPDTDAGAYDKAEAVIIPEEVTPPTGMPVVVESGDIEDAEIVTDPRPPAEGDVIGTIIATDLDLITAPEDLDAVDPSVLAVDETILDAMPVSEETIDEALASAPDRVVDEPEQPEAPAIDPPVEDTPPQSRGFRALTGVLILIIFALVCIAAYRMMMRPGGGMAEPTPTPIVPTEQTERPGPSASPSRSPKASEPTPVPALPPREPLPSDAAIPPALPGQSSTPEVMGGAGNVEIGQHTIALSQINDVNLPGLIDKPVAGENVQVQSILGDGAFVWMGSDQDNRVLAMIPEPYREALKDLQAGDRVDFVGTLSSADEPEILAPEQGRDRLIRQGAAIAVRDITVRQ